MLARVFRFHGHGSVRRAYRQGSSVRGNIGSLHAYSDTKHPKSKVAIVVSKKVDKSAVVRNRIRRRVYELVRLSMPDFTRPAELVFTIYQAEVATMPAEELQKEVHNLLKRAKVLL